MSDLQSQSWIEPFNPREIEILGLISNGLSNREISQKLLISTETVKWYNKQIFSKLGVNSRTQAVNIANRHGLLGEQVPPYFREASSTRSNLPAQLTSFVGRLAEVAEIKQLLRSSRLVTLTGAGGTGKTRLALQVARSLVDAYRDGVWLVELASISDPGLVANAITQVLKLSPTQEASLADVLARSVARKHLMLILDNFEHLLEATPLVSRLLASAPQVTVLATSREKLHLYGEQEYTVQPLKLPDIQGEHPSEQLLSNEAVNLFLQRARAAQPRLGVDEEQVRAIAQICVRLDGLPLALELAASQAKIYPLTVMAQRLEESLGSIPGGPRDLPERQRTLHATIEWSENLLQPEQKIFFARLGIFNGGGTLQAIEQVCASGLVGNTIELLTALIDKNLVIPREERDGEVRFLMLETIHEYARERMSASEDTEELHRLHAAYYTELAEKAGKEYRSSRQVYWNTRLRAEQDNLRAVLSWSLGGKEINYGLRIVSALSVYWYLNGFAAEGLRWANLALTRDEEGSLSLRAGVLCTAGNLAYNLNNLKTGKEYLQGALELYRKLGDEGGAATSSILLSITGVDTPHEIHQSIELALESLAVFRRLGDKPGTALALNILGELCRVEGDYEAAKGYYEACLEIVKETGELLRESMQYHNLGLIATHQNQHQLAEALIKQCLVNSQEIDNNYFLAGGIASLAGPTARLGFPERAARLLGAAHAGMESLGENQQPADQHDIDRFAREIQQELGEEAFRQAWQEGQAMTIEEAIEYALLDDDEDEGSGRRV
jgi:predicted ATPase/DNA-binding CsgD family transcriptional regulator